MKKFLLSLIALLAISFSLFAKEQAGFKLNFSDDEFVLETDNQGATSISSLGNSVFYSGNQEELALPYVKVNYAIKDTQRYKAFSFNVSKHLVKSDVILSYNEPQMPTIVGLLEENSSEISKKNIEGCPVSTCSYVGASKTDGVTILHFIVYPFEYEVDGKNLYLIDSVDVSLELSDEIAVNRISVSKTQSVGDTIQEIARTDSDFLKSIVINPNDIDGLTLGGLVRPIKPVNKTYDYVIITSAALADAFKPLVDWKRRKGVTADIVTVESLGPQTGIEIIDDNPRIAASSKETKLIGYIKFELERYRKAYGTKFVLLGGDDSVVPSPMVYGNRISDESPIPTDLYYGCSYQNNDWDRNGNGINGEWADSINLIPNLYVSRAPVKSVEDVQAFVAKTIAYEQAPIWKNNILIGGKHLSSNSSSNDAEVQGNLMYANYIEPYWCGELTRMYDTYTDVPMGGWSFTPYIIQTELQKGYNFVSILTHGSQTSWACENWTVYSTDKAVQQTGGAHTVITTLSCSTNAFDKYPGATADTCLSEAFIRNPNSGVIAYLGCSRAGFYNTSLNVLGPSLRYEAEFYKYLFSNEVPNKNFARIVAMAKANLIAVAQKNSVYQWIQYGLNPIGDPEMPIFIEEPKEFYGATMKQSGKSLTISTNVDSCRICIMSSGDLGKSYYSVYDNVESVTINDCPEKFDICISKQSYKPLLYSSSSATNDNKLISLYAQEKEIVESPLSIESSIYNRATGEATISIANLDDFSGDALLIVSDLRGLYVQRIPVDKGQKNVICKMSSMPAGIYVVSLVVNGNIADYGRIAK